MHKIFSVVSFILALTVGNLVGGELNNEGQEKLNEMLAKSKVSRRLLKCTVCKKEYGLKDNDDRALVYHIKVHHLKQYCKRFKCSQCPKTFSAKNSLKRHTSIKHSQSTLRPFKCSQCFKRFKREDNMHSHIKKVHQQQKNYRCTKCGKQSYARLKHYECPGTLEKICPPPIIKAHRSFTDDSGSDPETDTSPEYDSYDSLTEESSDEEPSPKRRRLPSRPSAQKALSFIQTHSEPESTLPSFQESSSSLTTSLSLLLAENAKPEGSDTDSGDELPELPDFD